MARCESMTWLLAQGQLPIWSRRLAHNMAGIMRQEVTNKWYNFDVEISEHLWSLWGGVHPKANWFDSQVRGQQKLGCCVVACCAASVFARLSDWSEKLLDAIVTNGDKYYRDSIAHTQHWDIDLGQDDLPMECDFEDMRFLVQLQLMTKGRIYNSPAQKEMNLSEALAYFFTRYQWGILVCDDRHLAFGYTSSLDGGYFLYDCSEWDKPIFPDNMGASYVLRAKELLLLIYCIIITLNVREKNVEFRLYSVDLMRMTVNSNDSQQSLQAVERKE